MDNSVDSIMLSLREEGLSLRAIGERLGVSHQAVFFRLGGQRTPQRKLVAANDNKIVKMMPHNGGCSTTSGEMPISLQRVPTMAAAEVALSARELHMRAYESRMPEFHASELQVAA